MRSSTAASRRGRTSRAVKFSCSWRLLVAQDHGADARIAQAPSDRQLRQAAAQITRHKRQLLRLRDALAPLGAFELGAQPLHAGERHARAIGHSLRVLARQDARGQRRPDCRAQSQRVVQARVVSLDLRALEQVVLRLLHRWRRDTQGERDAVSFRDLIGLPLRGAPVQHLALLDELAHGAHGFFQRRFVVGAVAEVQVEVVDLQPAQAVVTRIAHMLLGQAFLRRQLATPVHLGGHDVGAARPTELLQCLAHEAFRFAGGIALGVVEEVDSRVVGLAHQAHRGGEVDLLVEGHPRAKRQRADLQARGTKTTVRHLHHDG